MQLRSEGVEWLGLFYWKKKKSELFSNWNRPLFHYVHVEFKVWLKLKRKAKRKKHGNNFCQNALQWRWICICFLFLKLNWELLETGFYFPFSWTPRRADFQKNKNKKNQKKKTGQNKHLAGSVATNLREVLVPSQQNNKGQTILMYLFLEFVDRL